MVWRDRRGEANKPARLWTQESDRASHRGRSSRQPRRARALRPQTPPGTRSCIAPARVERDSRSGAHRFQRDANACEHTHSSCHRMRRPQGRSMQRAACSANATPRGAEPEGSKHRRNMNAATTSRLLPAPNLLSAKRTIESATLRMRMSTCAAPCQGASSCSICYTACHVVPLPHRQRAARSEAGPTPPHRQPDRKGAHHPDGRMWR